MLPRAARRPPREILKSIDNKENQPTQHRHTSLRIQQLMATECTSASRVNTPVRGRGFPSDNSQSQKTYLVKGEDSMNGKRYQSNKGNQQQQQQVILQPMSLNKLRIKTTVVVRDSIQNEQLIRLIPSTCDSNDYTIGPMIGKGSYAIVKLGSDRVGKRVAIKIYEKSLLKGERLNNLIKEISTLRLLSHEQVVKLHDVYHTGLTINLVLEFCGTESLYALLKSAPTRSLLKTQALQIIFQLLKILHYIHDRNVCHRDIKLENVLINNKRIKLIDFGFSTLANQNITCHCGTPSYMAPEVTLKLKYDGRATDIWALGVLFVSLVQGSFPFKGNNERELFRKIRNNEYNIISTDSDIKYLLSQIFVLDPTQRATAKELLQLDLFRNM